MAAQDYNKLIPLATDFLDVSQGDLYLNFGALSDWVEVDHVTFASADAGKHAKTTFPVQGSEPSFSAGEMGLYNFLNTVTGVNELYINRRGVSTTPFSASLLSTNPAPSNNSSGWTYLPSGLLIKWGNGSANGSATVSFPVASTIPVFTQVFSVQITNYAAGATDTDTFTRLTSFTNTGVTVYGSARSTTGATATTFQYLAIGY
jgi:hypothetical protein